MSCLMGGSLSTILAAWLASYAHQADRRGTGTARPTRCGRGGGQTLLRNSVRGSTLSVDHDTLEKMERYADQYGDGGWEQRLRALVAQITTPPDGAFAIGDRVRQPQHGVGKVLYCQDGFPKAKVRFAHGVEKVAVGELTAA